MRGGGGWLGRFGGGLCEFRIVGLVGLSGACEGGDAWNG